MNAIFNSSSARDDWDEYPDRFATLAMVSTVAVLAASFAGYLLSITFG